MFGLEQYCKESFVTDDIYLQNPLENIFLAISARWLHHLISEKLRHKTSISKYQYISHLDATQCARSWVSSFPEGQCKNVLFNFRKLIVITCLRAEIIGCHCLWSQNSLQYVQEKSTFTKAKQLLRAFQRAIPSRLSTFSVLSRFEDNARNAIFCVMWLLLLTASREKIAWLSSKICLARISRYTELSKR